MYQKYYSCTHGPAIDLEVPRVFQIESITSFWFTNAAAAPTTSYELEDRELLVPDTHQKQLKSYSGTK